MKMKKKWKREKSQMKKSKRKELFAVVWICIKKMRMKKKKM